MRRVLVSLVALGFLGTVSDRTVRVLLAEPAGTVQRGGAEPVDFNRDVRPILSKNCFACHGSDGGHRAAKLRLDQRDVAVKVLKSGHAAIVPGSPDESEMIRRLTAADEADRMPPKETGNHLKPAQVEVLKRWITQGAHYAEHWAFVKPRQRPLPAIKEKSWPNNGIDYFVLAELEKQGLKHNEAADRFTLLRRVSLDLRGLPPTPQEVDAFARDSSPDAYDKAVDRLLHDSAYGERWARAWLDQARYADSAGYGSDPLRPDAWRYRDWVIQAFNRNLPYDRFTIEQLAGDMLPDPTLEQKVATAFHRNTMTNTEGGTDREEYRVAAVKDRTDVTMLVWMGLTMGCAKCHSHKYDPITQKEYYQFYAFFNQSADNDQPDERPTLPAPSPALDAQNRLIDGKIADVKRKMEALAPRLAGAQEQWEKALRLAADWTVLEPLTATSEAGATLAKQTDHSIRVEGTKPANDVYTITARTGLKGITAFRLEAIPDATLPAGGAGRAPDGNFVLSRFSATVAPADVPEGKAVGRFVRVEIPGAEKILSLAEVQVMSRGQNVARGGAASQSSTDYDGPAALAIDGNTDGNYAAKSTTHTRTETNPWWEVKLAAATPIDQLVVWNRTDGSVGNRLANFRVSILDDARRVVWHGDVAAPPQPKHELSPSGQQTVVLTQAVADHSQPGFAVADALNPKNVAGNGWAVGPEVKSPHAATFMSAAPIGTPAPALLTFRLEHRYKMPNFTLGRFRLSATNDARVLERARVPADVLAIADLPAERRTREQREKLKAHYLSVAPEMKPLVEEVLKLQLSRPKPPNVAVMVELPPEQRRRTHLQVKGNFLVTGELVEAASPSAFHPFPKEAPKNRLGVAQWLLDPENPLTARVAVNRFWAQLFGAGLVRTEEDFGTQGELPSHPELLDWLALEFVRLNWDVKALLKLMVTSATYRQSSRFADSGPATSSSRSHAADATNRFLSRGPRFRLEAEMVRDQALALSGLLCSKVGGPSVYPPQPPGLWQAAFNGQRTWSTSTGEDRYRRGLYTFWRRTVPYPSMATFDAPSRETCTARRIRTNTPLQAFVTLNDPCFVEAAQSLARRIVREGGTEAKDRAAFAFRLCLCRPPQAAQTQLLLDLYQSELEHYRKDPKAAVALATDPLGPLPDGMQPAELAAWTVVANVLLNMDGVLMKG